jgi:hypothetical protein
LIYTGCFPSGLTATHDKSIPYIFANTFLSLQNLGLIVAVGKRRDVPNPTRKEIIFCRAESVSSHRIIRGGDNSEISLTVG